MMPEMRVGKQPLFQPRRRAREAEGGEDDERHRRQQRQKSADRTKAQRSPARDQIEMPFPAGAGLADLSRPIGRAHVELQSLMRISYAVLCLKKKNTIVTPMKSTNSAPHTKTN